MSEELRSQLTFILEPAREVRWLASAWRDLEQDSDASFFLSWAWIGTWLAEFPEQVGPLCLSARQGQNLVGLGLLTPLRVRRRGVIDSKQLHLNTTGEPEKDQLTIEYNGFLIHDEAPKGTASSCLAYVLQDEDLCDELYLDGVAPQWRNMAEGLGAQVLARKSSVCPFLDLREIGGKILDQFGYNTRHQIRRSLRLYGSVECEVAKDLPTAWRIWDELKRLHQDYWHSKGQSGAFDRAHFEPFHKRLIHDQLNSGKIQLIRVRGSKGTIGCLYNFVHRGRVYAYQSGFHASRDNRLKPGLVSHFKAIELNYRLGNRIYDFLAGDARYKRSLSNASNQLLWLVAQRPKFAFWAENRLRDLKNMILPTRP